MLARAFALEQFAAHSPAEVNWRALPAACIVQLHWHRTPEFSGLLIRHDFRVMTLLRHPLDVLLSILHFAPHEPQTARWLDGENGDEATIRGVLPTSDAFLAYAKSPRAQSLLSISREWYSDPGTRAVRYEDLVNAPAASLAEACAGYGILRVPLETVLHETEIDRLRRSAPNFHFWQGFPGLWKRLLPPRQAVDIAAAHSALFRDHAYVCDPDPLLSDAEAERNWHAIAIGSTGSADR
jgi:hypothetical protein